MNAMTIQIILLFVTHLLLPAIFVFHVWRARQESRADWLLGVLAEAAFVGYVFVAGHWSWLSHYSRYVLAAVFLWAVIVSWTRVKDRPLWVKASWGQWTSRVVGVLLLGLFSTFAVTALSGRWVAESPVEMAFPLRQGTYAVGHGGSNPIVNYHNVDRAQRFALDIGKLNALGLRAWGLYPRALERYEIYGDFIYSPCEGTVATAVDGLPDLIPPQHDRENLAGNHVVLRCGDVRVVLAHLMPGSLKVRSGDRIEQGQELGRVGNSGNTSEPHLHIHAMRGQGDSALQGEGVPILFDGRFLVRNSLVRTSVVKTTRDDRQAGKNRTGERDGI